MRSVESRFRQPVPGVLKVTVSAGRYCAPTSYNRIVLRFPAVLLLAILLAACGNELKSKEKVQEAILHRLQTSTGLDMNSLDVNTTAVTFDKNMAYATVSFHPKGDANITSGMVMKYTLEDQGGKWVVVSVADSQGHGMAGHGSASRTQLPPGHPAVNGMGDAGNPHGAPPQSANGSKE